MLFSVPFLLHFLLHHTDHTQKMQKCSVKKCSEPPEPNFLKNKSQN